MLCIKKFYEGLQIQVGKTISVAIVIIQCQLVSKQLM